MNKIILFVLILFFISGSFVTAFSPVSASELIEDSWNTKTPLDLVSFSNGVGTAVVDGKIYVMGGSQFGSGGINGCYDPVTDKWTILKPQPNQNSPVVVVVFQNKIYCMDSIAWSEVIEVYDIATDSWSTKSSIPATLTHVSQAHVIGEKIFVLSTPLLLLQNPFTNEWYNRCIIHLYEYDPVNEQLVERASVPFPLHHADCISVVVDDRIMVFGSFFTGTTLTVENNKKEYKVLVYDLNTDNWSEIKSNVPDGLGFNVAGATTGLYAPQKIYFFKSSQKDDTVYTGWSDCTYVYDPIDNSWSIAEHMPAPISGSYGVALVNDIFYVIGEGRIWYNSGSYNRIYLNLQYVPIGYQDISAPATSPPTPTPELSNSNPPEKSNPTGIFVTCLVVVAVTLTVGIIVCLFFYFKKRKKRTVKLTISTL